MNSMQQRVAVRTGLLCLTAVATLGCPITWATEREEWVRPQQREGRGPQSAYMGKRLQFKAPPSQLIDTWRCNWSEPYARPGTTWLCYDDPRLNHDFLLDPYVTQRLMPPLRALLRPYPTEEPALQAPASQLPSR